MPLFILLSSNAEGKIVAAVLFVLVIAFFTRRKERKEQRDKQNKSSN